MSINGLSRFLKYVFFFGIFYQLIPPIVYWTEPKWLSLRFDFTIGERHFDTSLLSLDQTCLTLLIMGLVSALSAWTMYLLFRLFQLYEHGEIFSEYSTAFLSKIGLVFLLSQFVYIGSDSILAYVLTYHAKHPTYILAVGTQELTQIVIALVTYFISKIMHEATKINAEHALII